MQAAEADDVSPHEATPSRAGFLPDVPSQQEVDDHLASAHFPPRAWCGACVAGKATSLPHTSQKASRTHGIPVVSCDYFYLGDEGDLGPPFLAVKDGRSGRLFALALVTKGQGDYNEDSLSRLYVLLGYKTIACRSDNEPAMLTHKLGAMARAAGVDCQPEESPVGEPESNGEAESGVREIKKQVRCLWVALLERYGNTDGAVADGDAELDNTHPIFAFLVEWAAASHTRFAVGADGRTGWFRHKAKAWKGRFPEFGECIFFMPIRHGGRLASRKAKWTRGAFCGVIERSGEIKVMTPDGVFKARSYKRAPLGDRWSRAFLRSYKGTPWCPRPGSDESGILPAAMVYAPSAGDIPVFPDSRSRHSADERGATLFNHTRALGTNWVQPKLSRVQRCYVGAAAG